MQHMGVDPFFNAYPKRARWIELAEALVGEEVDASEPEWFNKPPNTEHPTPPHQDNFYFCLKPPNVLTLWLALDPVDEENGCLRYIRGSHAGGIRLHGPTQVLGFSQSVSDYGPEEEASEEPMLLEPGDLVIHHGETIHRADPNRSATRHRRAFGTVYRGKSCRRDEAAFQRYKDALDKQHRLKGLDVDD
ncbi:MAG: phytanoyl-CoA dioxygenase family protein, partial [Planctomycetota bacterium]|nr:phytanoyl-CoA dioxygenase family protein [Planctomycetota bacterium]